MQIVIATHRDVCRRVTGGTWGERDDRGDGEFNNDLSLVIRGLCDNLLPDDMTVTISSDGCTLAMDLIVWNGYVLLDIHSDECIDNVIDIIMSSDSSIVSVDGSIVDVDRKTVTNVISLLDTMRGML